LVVKCTSILEAHLPNSEKYIDFFYLLHIYFTPAMEHNRNTLYDCGPTGTHHMCANLGFSQIDSQLIHIKATNIIHLLTVQVMDISFKTFYLMYFYKIKGNITVFTQFNIIINPFTVGRAADFSCHNLYVTIVLNRSTHYSILYICN
jgi:hypothetical protein